MKIKKTKAIWSYSLYVCCPHCQYEFDLFDYEADWNSTGVDFYAGETDTSRTIDVSVYCPDCDQEFECDFEV